MVRRSLGLTLRSVLVVALVSMIGAACAPHSGSAPSSSAVGLAYTSPPSPTDGGSSTPGRPTPHGVEWRREPGGTLTAVAVNAEGMIYVTGSIEAPPVMPGTDVHVTAMVVAKYNRAGKLLWRRTWRRSGLWFANGQAVAPAPAGGVYVAGRSGQYEGWSPVLWRYSASGRLLWRRTLPSPLGRGDMRSIATDADGVVAAVNNSETGGPTAGGNFLYAFDHAGKPVWRTPFAVPGITGTMNGVNGVAIGDDGRVYAAGFVSLSPLDAPDQDRDVVVQQMDRGGHVRWTRVLADPGVSYDEAQAVDARSGLVVVAGSTGNWTRAAVWAFTPEGERRWTRSWGHVYYTTAAAVTIATWGAVYVAADRTVFGPGDTSTTTASLRCYEPDGTFVSSRAADDYVGGVAAADALYLVVGPALERWMP